MSKVINENYKCRHGDEECKNKERIDRIKKYEQKLAKAEQKVAKAEKELAKVEQELAKTGQQLTKKKKLFAKGEQQAVKELFTDLELSIQNLKAEQQELKSEQQELISEQQLKSAIKELNSKNKELKDELQELKDEERMLVQKNYLIFDAIAEDTMFSEGWAKSWQELDEKFPPDFPHDMLPDSIIKARKFRENLKRACDGLASNDAYRSAGAALTFCIRFFDSYREPYEKMFKQQLSEKANAVKSDKKEKLYTSALTEAKMLAKDNSSWNNVQITEEVLKDKTFESLSPRELKKRILETFPDRNHRKNRK